MLRFGPFQKVTKTIVLSLCATLALSACGDDDDDVNPVPDTPAEDEQEMNWEKITFLGPCVPQQNGGGGGSGETDSLCQRDQNTFVINADGTFNLNGMSGVLQKRDFDRLRTTAQTLSTSDLSMALQCRNMPEAENVRLTMEVVEPQQPMPSPSPSPTATEDNRQTRSVELYREEDNRNRACVIEAERQRIEEFSDLLSGLAMQYLKANQPAPSPSPNPSPSPTPQPGQPIPM